MFYTLSTKIPNIMSGKKLLKIFVIGSVCYVVSNYFLQINKASEKLKLLNKYFYYAMVLDFIIASIIVKFYKEEEKDDNDINDEINNSVNEVIKIQNENLAADKQKLIKNVEPDNEEDVDKEEEEDVEEDEDPSESLSLSPKKNKKSKNTKNTKKEHVKKHEKKHKKQSQNTDTDTQIPVFVNS
jgi:hypothetical protein